MRKTALAPGQLLLSVYMEKSCLGKAGYPPLEVALGQRKTHLNSYRRQTMHLGKVNPGVSELPWGKLAVPGSCEQALSELYGNH